MHLPGVPRGTACQAQLARLRKQRITQFEFADILARSGMLVSKVLTFETVGTRK